MIDGPLTFASDFVLLIKTLIFCIHEPHWTFSFFEDDYNKVEMHKLFDKTATTADLCKGPGMFLEPLLAHIKSNDKVDYKMIKNFFKQQLDSNDCTK